VVSKDLFGKLAYGALFCILLPAVLAFWAHRLDASVTGLWPQPLPRWTAWALLLVGLALMAAAMWELWTQGNGLPMNAYPPTRFVSSSVYAFLAHPIYLAFIAMVAGASVMLNSAAGLWIVTPVVALGSAALVVGHEGPKLRERFGAPLTAPWLGMPLRGESRPTIARRLSAGLSGLGPWALALALFSNLPAPQGAAALRLAWEAGLPRFEWALWLSSAGYVLAMVSFAAAGTGDQLRQLVRGAWLTTGIGFFVMLMMPGETATLPHRPPTFGDGPGELSRALYTSWLAFPSFDAAWAVFAAFALGQSEPRLRMVWRIVACATLAACLLTGAHALVGILGGVAVGALAWQHDRVWRALVEVGEHLGNSWTCIRLGRLRVISHALWSGAAGVAGALLALFLAGAQALVPCAVVLLAGLLSAGTWGYLLEGGGRLSRPFGYYGFLLGSLVALAAMALVGTAGVETLSAALAAAAPVAQAIGRLRCIVQGCCHGRPTKAAYGLRITHRMSRVVALANLPGVPIHPTQMYSIVGNVALTFVLLRLWNTGAAWTLIAGLYLVLASLARFVEEQYRGEPQTIQWLGLPIYQWLAIGFAVLGVALTMVRGAPVMPAQWLSWSALALAAGTGLAAALLMSVDFPESARRFSRLTVSGV
jgi:protein-S-isoprenylcysteine O-methyltransferase Ste14